MTAALGRVEENFGDLASRAIDFSPDDLGSVINRLISDVGRLHYVSIADLRVFGRTEANPPGKIDEAMRYGTKIMDAIYYFSIQPASRPPVAAGVDGIANLANTILVAKKRLLWTAMFLMLRGSYPDSVGNVLGTDVPAFLVNIAGMNESPREVASGIASFNLRNIPTGWIEAIQWATLAPEIRQRLALGLAGYRLLGPFKVYNVRSDATDDVRQAASWVRDVAMRAPDYDILSATRSAELISRLGSWNKALGNLILLSFTTDQINEMVANKILFQRPNRDPRADTWRAWAQSGPLALTRPIGL